MNGYNKISIKVIPVSKLFSSPSPCLSRYDGVAPVCNGRSIDYTAMPFRISANIISHSQ